MMKSSNQIHRRAFKHTFLWVFLIGLVIYQNLITASDFPHKLSDKDKYIIIASAVTLVVGSVGLAYRYRGVIRSLYYRMTNKEVQSDWDAMFYHEDSTHSLPANFSDNYDELLNVLRRGVERNLNNNLDKVLKIAEDEFGLPVDTVMNLESSTSSIQSANFLTSEMDNLKIPMITQENNIVTEANLFNAETSNIELLENEPLIIEANLLETEMTPP